MGIPGATITSNVGTLRHALQKPNDTRCSSSVDAYQRFFPSAHACCKAMVKASRHFVFVMVPGEAPKPLARSSREFVDPVRCVMLTCEGTVYGGGVERRG